jgi:2-phosphosulfolactate phosphatase
MEVFISQHVPHPNTEAYVIIDVLRAFTMSHCFFKSGAREIYLSSGEQKARALKSLHPDFLLAGEVKGYKIKGFDFGNSPTELLGIDIKDRCIIQCTTNGTRSVFEVPKHADIFCAGFINLRSTANHLRMKQYKSVTIVCSDPSGEDDLICSKALKLMILGVSVSLSKYSQLIYKTPTAQKFLDINNEYFPRSDLEMATTTLDHEFVMQVIGEPPHLVPLRIESSMRAT